MTIYETLDLIKTGLAAGNTASTDLLYKVNVETDPYLDFTSLLPLVLIEADRTEFVNAQGYGHVVNQDHYFTFTCIEQAQNLKFSEYKSKVNQLIKKTINKLMTINHDDIQKIIPTDMSHSEMMIGSLKTTAIVITVKVRTYWKDLPNI